MSRQVEVCAGRLPEPVRAEFVRLMDEARELHRQGGARHRDAWALYRQHAELSPGKDTAERPSPDLDGRILRRLTELGEAPTVRIFAGPGAVGGQTKKWPRWMSALESRGMVQNRGSKSRPRWSLTAAGSEYLLSSSLHTGREDQRGRGAEKKRSFSAPLFCSDRLVHQRGEDPR